MAYLEPARHPLWKAELRHGRGRSRRSRRGRRAPRAHPRRDRATTPTSPRGFATDAHLPRHPARALSARDRAAAIPTSRRGSAALVDATAATKRALVHGDVSPKNILVGPGGPVFLDAECAWYGDPGVRPRLLPQPPAAQVPVDAAGAAPASSPASTRWPAAYLAGVDWEPRGRARGARGRGCCPACCSRGSTASRRSST